MLVWLFSFHGVRTCFEYFPKLARIYLSKMPTPPTRVLRSAEVLFETDDDSTQHSVTETDGVIANSSCFVDVAHEGGENAELSGATMRYLESLFKQHEARLSKRFEASIRSSEEKLLGTIASLEKKLAEKDSIIKSCRDDFSKAVSQMSVVRAANDHLMLELDNHEQYGRRMNVRLEGIEYKEDETNEELKVKI